jgi:hypothetical protein
MEAPLSLATENEALSISISSNIDDDVDGEEAEEEEEEEDDEDTITRIDHNNNNVKESLADEDEDKDENQVTLDVSTVNNDTIRNQRKNKLINTFVCQPQHNNSMEPQLKKNISLPIFVNIQVLTQDLNNNNNIDIKNKQETVSTNTNKSSLNLTENNNKKDLFFRDYVLIPANTKYKYLLSTIFEKVNQLNNREHLHVLDSNF